MLYAQAEQHDFTQFYDYVYNVSTTHVFFASICVRVCVFVRQVNLSVCVCALCDDVFFMNSMLLEVLMKQLK